MNKQLLTLILAVCGWAYAGFAIAEQGNFVGHLAGAEEVPPVETHAQGQVIFKLRGDGELSYKLIVANIQNVVAAHIHCAPQGGNGPVGVTLFLGVPVSMAGILAEGPLLATDPDNGCGWASLDDLIVAFMMGEAYVNVHTLANLPGEIRGQVR